jgi:hypothetical protein
LNLQKRFDSLLLYKIEIFYHAHPVIRAVALIQLLQAPAWILCAFVAKLHQSVPKQLAIPLHENAVLPTRPAARAIGSTDALFF